MIYYSIDNRVLNTVVPNSGKCQRKHNYFFRKKVNEAGDDRPISHLRYNALLILTDVVSYVIVNYANIVHAQTQYDYVRMNSLRRT